MHNLVTTETVIAAPNHSGATVVTNNGNPITLVVGTNTIPVEVTAADGTTKITYTVTITRSPSSDATLSNLISSIGTLTPGFAPATTAYTLAVNHSVTTLTLTPTVNEPNATAVINGGLPIGLVVGGQSHYGDGDGARWDHHTPVYGDRDAGSVQRRDPVEPDQQHRHAHPRLCAGHDGL